MTDSAHVNAVTGVRRRRFNTRALALLALALLTALGVARAMPTPRRRAPGAGAQALLSTSFARRHLIVQAPLTPSVAGQFAFVLKTDDAGLERLASAVSDPSSAQYGQYQPIASLARRFGARGAGARALAYLRSDGVSDAALDQTGLFVSATLSERQVKRLLGGAQQRFSADAAGAQRPAPVALPRALSGLVSGVVGSGPAQTLQDPTLAKSFSQATTGSEAPLTGTSDGCAHS